jgi:membrane protein DedA with SNARE-associated domain
MIQSILVWLASLIISVISNTGYLGVTFLMTLESAGILIPSEVIMPFSGYLAGTGGFSLWLVVFWGTVGNVFGSLVLYAVGYYGGRPFALRYGRYFFFTAEELEKSDEWFKKYGLIAVFFGRMLPVARTYISLPAGIVRMDLSKFLIYTFFGSVPWNLALAYIGFFLGENWKNIEVYFRKFDYIILIFLAAGVVWFLWSHFFKKKISKK